MYRWILLLLVSVMLTGCAVDRPPDAAALVQTMVGALPDGGAAGQLYFFDALDPDPDAHTAAAMPDSLIAAAFGDGCAVPPEFAAIEAYAVRLCGFAEPIECGCFVAARERDAEAIAAMCLRRVEAAARLCGREVTAEPPLVMGRCVFYAIGSGADAALAVARAAMRGT